MSNQTAQYVNIFKNRRTIYDLKPELPAGVSIQDIQATVQTIVAEAPTAFNSQCNRAVILIGDSHKQVWSDVVNAMSDDSGKKRPISARDEAYGTVVFFTDDKVTKKLQDDFPAFAAAFPGCATQSSGGAQITAWAAVESLGLGAHLQHYNDVVKKSLGGKIPSDWTVMSQLCFGVTTKDAPAKTYIDNQVNILN